MQEESKSEEAPAEESVQAEDRDRKSIYVGNVDYSASSEELREFFHSCGAIVRVTIPTGISKTPKGYAYIEFSHPQSVVAAQAFNERTFKGRRLKVLPKRTNVPGKSKHKFRGSSRGGGARRSRNGRFWS